MARRQEDSIEKKLCHLFPSAWLATQAREVGMIQRQRKVDPVALFWTLVLGFGVGKQRSIASLRRAYEGATGTLLSASSFYDRFTSQLVALLCQACSRTLQPIQASAPLMSEALSAFHDILITDATVLRLHALLKKTYPACRTNHTQAAAKLHMVLSVLGKSAQQIRFTAERKREGQVLTIGEWVKGRLLLFDLGYFSYGLLDRIHRAGGFFVSRLKDGCNPTIVAVHQGCGQQLVGRSLQSALWFIRREILDVEVEVTYKKRRYRGKRRQQTQRFRLVGLKNPLTGAYHLYLTNISPQQFAGQAIAQIYSARWLIELIFKTLKSFYQLESFPSTNPHIVHALLYAAILTMLVSRQIEQVLHQRLASEGRVEAPDKELFPLLRLAAVLHAFSAALLHTVVQAAGCPRGPSDLTDQILKEVKNPNRKRNCLRRRIQNIETVT